MTTRTLTIILLVLVAVIAISAIGAEEFPKVWPFPGVGR
jgi:hypothetical protein